MSSIAMIGSVNVVTLRLTGAVFTLPTAEKLLSRLPAMQVGGVMLTHTTVSRELLNPSYQHTHSIHLANISINIPINPPSHLLTLYLPPPPLLQALLKTFVIPASVPFIPTIADKIAPPIGIVDAPPSPSNQESGGGLTTGRSAGRLSARPASGLGPSNMSSTGTLGHTLSYPHLNPLTLTHPLIHTSSLTLTSTRLCSPSLTLSFSRTHAQPS